MPTTSSSTRPTGWMNLFPPSVLFVKYNLRLKVCVRRVKQVEVVVLWIPFPTQQVQPLTCLSMVIQGTQ